MSIAVVHLRDIAACLSAEAKDAWAHTAELERMFLDAGARAQSLEERALELSKAADALERKGRLAAGLRAAAERLVKRG